MTRLLLLWRLWCAPYRHVCDPWSFDAQQRAAWAEMVEGASVKYGQQR